MQVIVFSGKQGSGKTTLQNALTDYLVHRGQLVFSINFADVLYEMHDAVLKILHRYTPPRQIVKDGPLLQLLGTEWGRKTIHENIWVSLLQGKIALLPAGSYVIVGDCRFENEFDAIPEALRVRLECDETVRRERCSMWRQNTEHPSETGLDAYAAAGKFDLYLQTDQIDAKAALTLVLAQLDKKVYLEKRTW